MRGSLDIIGDNYRNILFPSMSYAIDRAALLSIRFYLKKKFNWRGKKRGIVRCLAWLWQIFCIEQMTRDDPHAPFQRFLPALPRYLWLVERQKFRFSASGIFLSRDTLALSCVGVTLARDKAQRISRKYASTRKETRFPLYPLEKSSLIEGTNRNLKSVSMNP